MSKNHNVTASVETITPKMAQELLDRADAAEFRNRPPSPSWVRTLAKSLQSGNFDLTGEPIILDEDGVPVDGRHRLLACIESDTPIMTVVVRGVERRVFTHIDCGPSRSVGDVLYIEGVQNAKMVAAAARLVLAYERGVVGKFGAAISATVTRDDCIAEGLDPIYQTGAPYASAVARSRGVTASSSLAFFVLAMRHGEDPRRVYDFLDGIATGANLRVHDARLGFINTANKFVRERHLNVNQSWLAMLITAWCPYRDGKRLRGRPPTVQVWTGETSFPSFSSAQLVALDGAA